MSGCSSFVGVLGAAIGACATLGAQWLNHFLQNKKANSLAEKRRQRLRRELENKRFVWRSLERLTAVIGADQETTVGLLIEIDARAEKANANLWALESRAPYPEDETKGK